MKNKIFSGMAGVHFQEIKRINRERNLHFNIKLIERDAARFLDKAWVEAQLTHRPGILSKVRGDMNVEYYLKSIFDMMVMESWRKIYSLNFVNDKKDFTLKETALILDRTTQQIRNLIDDEKLERVPKKNKQAQNEPVLIYGWSINVYIKNLKSPL